jgi:hypothetical protein
MRPNPLAADFDPVCSGKTHAAADWQGNSATDFCQPTWHEIQNS